MAIGLSDLSVNKEIKKTPVLKEEVIDSSANQKQQRPWDAKTQSQKSTVASLALKKAAEVSIKNDHQAHELRKNYIASEKELELNQYIENRQREFQNLDNSKKLHSSSGRIKTHRSLLKRLRDSLFS